MPGSVDPISSAEEWRQRVFQEGFDAGWDKGRLELRQKRLQDKIEAYERGQRVYYLWTLLTPLGSALLLSLLLFRSLANIAVLIFIGVGMLLAAFLLHLWFWGRHNERLKEMRAELKQLKR